MTGTEAEDLAVRILRTWPRMSIPPDEWEHTLADLDAGTAGTAYVRLRNNEKHPPSIADFVNVYRGLATPTNLPVREQCRSCGGDGYNTIHETVQGRDYEAFVACRCSNGDRARVTLGDVRAFNDAVLGRMYPDRNTRPDPPPVSVLESLFDRPPRTDLA